MPIEIHLESQSPGCLRIRSRYFCAFVGILLQLLLVASDGRAQEKQHRAPVEQQGAAPMRDVNELIAVRVDGIGLHLQSTGSIRSIGTIPQPDGRVLILLAGHRSGRVPPNQEFSVGSVKRIELQGGGDGEMALTRILVTPRQPGKFRLHTTAGSAWLRWIEPPSSRLAEETGGAVPESPLPTVGRNLRTTVALNVRIAPSRRSTRIDQLSPGQWVEELRRDGSWVRVRFGGRAGWVHGGYLDEVPEPEERVAEQAVAAVDVAESAAAQSETTEEIPVSTAPAAELSESAVKTPKADRGFSLASWPVALPGGEFLPTVSARHRSVATDESPLAADEPALVSVDVADLVVPLPADDVSEVPTVERAVAADVPSWAGDVLVSSEDLPALVADVLAPAGGLPAPTADRRASALTADRHASVAESPAVAADVPEASAGVRFLRSTVALNVRTKPSTDALSIAVLDPGQLVAELYREGDWARVGFPGGIGWSHGDYLVYAATEPEARFKQVTEAMNLWNTPRATWPIAVLFPGQLVEELGRHGDLVQVRSAKGTGWVQSQSLGAASELAVLAHEAQTKTDEGTQASYRSLRNTVALNVRTGPSKASWRLDLLYPGQRVEELDREGDWVKVRFTGGIGWVHGDYLAPVAPRRAVAKQMLAATLDAASDDASSSNAGRPVESARGATARETVGEP